MTRAYLRLDPDFAERKRAYPDGAYRALIDVFCAAEQEPKRGTFRSMAILRALLGRSARFIPYLLAHNDLQLVGDRILVVGWDVWQEGDWKVAERVRRIRERRELEPTVTPDVTVADVPVDTSPTVSTLQDGKPLAVSGKRLAGSSAPRSPTDAQIVKAWLSEHGYGEPSGWAIKPFREMLKRLGKDGLLGLFREAQGNGVMLSNGLVTYVEQVLQSRRPGKNGKYIEHPQEELSDAFVRE